MPTQIERLEARASHLLDGFLHLRERYALLKPMLFDAEVVQRHGSKRRYRGFQTLRHSLFLSCAQDIAKYASDGSDDTKAPSIGSIVKSLQDPKVSEPLRTRYAAWRAPALEEETDPVVIEALRHWEIREEAERRIEFDERRGKLDDSWQALCAGPTMLKFRTIRDKLTAHTEIRYVADKYVQVDIGALGIKWADMDETIAEMQRAVELVGNVVRNAGFAWDALDRQLADAASGFWSEADVSPPQR